MKRVKSKTIKDFIKENNIDMEYREIVGERDGTLEWKIVLRMCPKGERCRQATIKIYGGLLYDPDVNSVLETYKGEIDSISDGLDDFYIPWEDEIASETNKEKRRTLKKGIIEKFHGIQEIKYKMEKFLGKDRMMEFIQLEE